MEYRGYRLDPFQERAVRSIEAGRDLVVAAPTGAGKTLIAEYALDHTLAAGRRLIYTAPIKALSNQKYRDLKARYGDDVGIVTGDVSLNPDAPALIMTTEIFRNEIFDAPQRIEGVAWVVLDEVHYMDDDERGTVWEESIIFAPPPVKFLCLSATIPNLRELTGWMESVRGRPVDAVQEETRPVPLEHRLWIHKAGFVELKDLGNVAHRLRRRKRPRRGKAPPLGPADLLRHIRREGRLPVLYFAFQRRTCEAMARRFGGLALLDQEASDRAAAFFDELLARCEVPAEDGLARRLRRLVSNGVAYHHAGLLPTLKEIVEQLFQAGHLKLLFTTETFAMGINMPAASVVFDAMDKFDGVKFSPLMTREYQQMAGRAGRRGMDEKGFVYAQAEPRHLDPAGIRSTLTGRVEPVVSRFNLGYSTVLNLYARLGEGIFEVSEKSLAAYQARRRRKGRRRRAAFQFSKSIARRLRVLEALGYVRGRELLPRGRFAARAPGRELQLTELLFGGVLEDLDPDYLNVALTALVFEPRRKDSFQPLDTAERWQLQRATEQALARVRAAERHGGVALLTPQADFGLSAAVHRWSRGASFVNLADLCTTDPGDLVRTLRMSIQLARQLVTSQALSPALRRTVGEALGRVNRDVVDAERQLRRS